MNRTERAAMNRAHAVIARQHAQTPEARAARSEGLRAKWTEEPYRSAVTAAIQERQRSPETRAHLAEVMRARWADPEQRARLLAARRSPRTPEQRARMAAAMRDWHARRRAQLYPDVPP